MYFCPLYNLITTLSSFTNRICTDTDNIDSLSYTKLTSASYLADILMSIGSSSD